MELDRLLIGVTPLVYVLVDQAKVLIPAAQHRYLPPLSGGLGLATTLAALYFTGTYSSAEWFWTCVNGTLLGFGAVGLNQMKKQQEVKS